MGVGSGLSIPTCRGLEISETHFSQLRNKQPLYLSVMVGETANETWYGNIWKNSRKSVSWEPEKPVLGILAFEVSRLMSKVVNLWQSLTDMQIVKLRENIANSVGIRKLISEDDGYLSDLALAEIIQNFECLAKSVAMLGKKCKDPMYHDLENIFDVLDEIAPKWYGWRYRLKKMDRKVKKMDKFVGTTEQLYQEIEVLAELEQSLKRMRAGANKGRVKLLEFQQKVVWQRQEVKNLREMTPWARTYDYIVRLLLRSLSTIFERVKYVYGTDQIGKVEENNYYGEIHSNHIGRFIRNNSISALLKTSVYPSENNPSKFLLPLERTFSGLGLGLGCNKIGSKNRKFSQLKARGVFTSIGFTGCMTSGSESPFIESYKPSCGSSFRSNASCKDAPTICSDLSSTKTSFFNSKRHLLGSSPSTLGYAALSLHYANIVILIEKLASSPHLISLDARDDLYNMLPATIKSCLRAKLKTLTRNSASSVYDAAFAAEWSLAVTRILEWLSPLAHNMVRWQSERNFERQRLVCGSNVLLVQTLHFANQSKTEAAIVELLMGLNYLYRLGQEMNEKPFRESSCSGAYLCPTDNLCYNMIDHTTREISAVGDAFG